LSRGVLVLLLTGCGAAHQAFERAASQAGLERAEVQGRGYRHALYSRPRQPMVHGPIHVYLTGDGRPYAHPGVASADPTPRQSVVLRLLALDPAQVFVLGRPCYHGYADAPPCSQNLWTHARYGEAVVASMAEALTQAVPLDHGLVLIGFSGGGALSMLLAARVPEVVAVVTLAGNLDIDAWADVHGYTRLRRSLNPVREWPLSEGAVQLHYAGAQDRQVPPALSREAVRHTGGELALLPETRHQTGWERHWAGILAELDRRLDRRP